jgi:hypothetical protein
MPKKKTPKRKTAPAKEAPINTWTMRFNEDEQELRRAIETEADLHGIKKTTYLKKAAAEHIAMSLTPEGQTVRLTTLVEQALVKRHSYGKTLFYQDSDGNMVPVAMTHPEGK